MMITMCWMAVSALLVHDLGRFVHLYSLFLIFDKNSYAFEEQHTF
jgi:hypothetical protein